MQSQPTVEDLTRLWSLLEEPLPTTAGDGEDDAPAEEAEELRRRLRAVASMISLMGLDPEAGASGCGTDGRSSAYSPTVASGDERIVDGREPEYPARIPGYEILGELGRGGMGVVYKARQEGLDRVVAIKMILSAAHASPMAMSRFLHESRAIAALRHENVVQVFDSGSHDGMPFFSLEYMEGGSLADRLRGDPQAADRAAMTVEALARAVQAAHGRGIVHRDLKPANVLLTADGVPKITDFGIAKQGDSIMTATGDVLGTPSYMAPEQAEGKNQLVGPAADIYALGAILYELLTGRPPFKGASAWDTIQLLTKSEAVRPRLLHPRVPADLETICLKCLEKEPARRYASAEALAGDLRRFLDGEPIQARPVGGAERAWRWCLRNKALAASLTAVAASLVAASVVSVAFGVRAERARDAAAARLVSETKAKKEADDARRGVQEQLIDLSAEAGLTAARKGDQSLALLWFARTAQLSADDLVRQDLGRVRFANWLRQTWTPEGAWSVPGFRQDKDQFREFLFSPDGHYLMTAERNGPCLIWDRAAGRAVPLPGPSARATAAAWEPKTGRLAVGGDDGKVLLLAPPTFRVAEEIPAEGRLICLGFSNDGRRIAWGGDAGARVWDREKKEFLTPLLPHGAPVATIKFSGDGALMATSARDVKARVYRTDSARSEPIFPPVPHTPGNSASITAEPTGSRRGSSRMTRCS